MTALEFPNNWHWLSDDGRIYSSAVQALVSKTNAHYVDWLTSGNIPTRWPQDNAGEQTDAELAKVLAPYRLVIGTLSDIKAGLKMAIDSAAETERLKYITPGTGQAMTYQQKVAEAQGYKAATIPKPEDYPILASEVGITAPTLSEVADTVLAAYRQWQQIGAMIEAIRLGAKRDIDAAETEAAARAVVEAIVWPSAQQGGTSNE